MTPANYFIASGSRLGRRLLPPDCQGSVRRIWSYLRSFARLFFESIDTRAGADTLVTLDDMHQLHEAPALLDALAFGIGKLSKNVSFVIASREAPPSSWARFSADGRMATFGPDMLLMDPDEIRSLLTAHAGWPHGSDDRVVSALLAASHGWASGVGVLIELAKTRSTDHPFFCESEARDLVFGNFSDLIFSSFSPTEQHQLMLVAPCQVIYPKILGEVIGNSICRLLDRLSRNNTLVSRNYSDGDQGRPSYRLHAEQGSFSSEHP